ncbi:MAG: hypothetical protein GY701_10025 [Sulfitobacter sp.]|nr:hypothetical protein [Sulfitobacter sp.]
MTRGVDRSPRIESWAATLGFLADEVAIGIETMARRLHLVMDDEHPTGGGSFEPNGYGGLERRGPLDRLLLSDWVLADVEPDEFTRRLVSSELSYLRLEHSQPKPPSRISVVVDAGPDQIGAPRLAQLAGLVVLERRARALGVPLAVGVLGDEPGHWVTGDLPELFTVWLRARRLTEPTRELVGEWADSLDDVAATWIFGAPRLATDDMPARCHRFVGVESAWGPEGATQVTVTADNKTVDLPVPDPRIAVRILRGYGLRRRARLHTGVAEGSLRFPRFPGSVRQLVCRGDNDNELVVMGVPQDPGAAPGRLRRRKFAGQVLAASVIGPRTVALVAVAGDLRVVVVGKKLGKVETIEITAAELGLDQDAIDELAETTLEPLYFFSGSIVVRLADQWWSIEPPGEVQPRNYVAGAASRVVDRPRLAYNTTIALHVDDRSIRDIRTDGRVLLGGGAHVAVEQQPGSWSIDTETSGIEIDPAATVHGLAVVDRQPALIVQSPGGHLVRLVGTQSTKTLTKLSAEITTIEVHPTEPLAAFQRVDGTIDVIDLEQSEILLHLQPGAT